MESRLAPGDGNLEQMKIAEHIPQSRLVIAEDPDLARITNPLAILGCTLVLALPLYGLAIYCIASGNLLPAWTVWLAGFYAVAGIALVLRSDATDRIIFEPGEDGAGVVRIERSHGVFSYRLSSRILADRSFILSPVMQKQVGGYGLIQITRGSSKAQGLSASPKDSISFDVLFVAPDQDMETFGHYVAGAFGFGYVAKPDSGTDIKIARDPFPGSTFASSASITFPRNAETLPEVLLTSLPVFEPSKSRELVTVKEWEPGRSLVCGSGKGETLTRIALVGALVGLIALTVLWLLAVWDSWASSSLVGKSALAGASALATLTALFLVFRYVPMLPGSRFKIGGDVPGVWSSAGWVAASTVPVESIHFLYVDLQASDSTRRLRVFFEAGASSHLMVQTPWRSSTTMELVRETFPFVAETSRILGRPSKVSKLLAAELSNSGTAQETVEGTP